MEVRNVWGGEFEVLPLVNQSSDDDGGDEYDKAACKSSSSEEEVKQGWFLRPNMEAGRKKKRIFYVNQLMVRTLLVAVVLAGLVLLVSVTASRLRHRRRPVAGPDNYTAALHRALMFFNAQRSGRLPKYNNVSWRNDSCLKDDPIGGYYDSGNTVKFSFPASFAMTMLSWSVIEYSEKFAAVGELDHVRSIIKWGTDYLLKTLNSSAGDIGSIVAQVGGEHDQHCWMRPEDIDSDNDYPRPMLRWSNCPALAGEMAAALAAASIVFKESTDYSEKLVHGAGKLFKFATKYQAENYSGGSDPPSAFYNSSGFWDEFVWAGAWLYCATGNLTYLRFATRPELFKKDTGFSGRSHRGVLSWDNKHAGAQLLLTRMRIFLGYGYPYEETLRLSQNQVETMMCSYLPAFHSLKRTKGGLIQLNHGRSRPLQYVVNAVFLANLYSDYLESNLIPGWQCGPLFYSVEALRNFARNQMDYILGKNPHRMSYIVGYGAHFPQHLHHRGSSIPKNGVKYSCEGGRRWRASRRPNPNIIVGAMVGGPDAQDNFEDVRSNYNYTEPTIAGNAGLIAALVTLSGGKTSQIDRNTIFYAIPPLYVQEPPPPPPWKP